MLFSLSACEYEFDEDNFVDVEIPKPASTLLLRDFKDGQVLTQGVAVRYIPYKYGKQQFRLVKAYIDNSEIYSSLENRDKIILINTDPLNEGEHIFTIEYIFSSGSGSLADLNGSEMYIKTDNYKFIVDKSISSISDITSIDVLNGSIYLKWDGAKMDTSNFDEAYLVVYEKENDDFKKTQKYRLSKEIVKKGAFRDLKSVSLADKKYKLLIQNHYNKLEGGFKELTIDGSLELRQEILRSSKIRVSWDKHPLYSNFDHYTYRGTLYPNVSDPIYDETEKLSNLGGEIIIQLDKPIMGTHIKHYLKVVTRGGGSRHSFGGLYKYGIPVNLQNVSDMVYSKKSGYVYSLYVNIYHEGFIQKRSYEDLSIITDAKILTASDFTHGPGGVMVIDPKTGNILVDAETCSIEVDPISLDVVKKHYGSEFVGYDIRRITHRGDVIEVITGEMYSIFKLESKELLFSEKRKLLTTTNSISIDGRYFVAESGIYEIENNTVTRLIDLSEYPYHLRSDFNLDKNYCVFSFSEQVPIIFNLQTKTSKVVDTSGYIEEIQFCNNSGMLLLHHRGKYDGYDNIEIINLESRASFDINITGEGSFLYNRERGRAWFLDGKLLDSHGYYLNNINVD